MTWRWAAALAAAAVTSTSTSAIAGEALVGAVSTVDLSTMNDDGKLDHFGAGAGLSLVFLELSSHDMGFGFEGSAIFADGPDGTRLYDLGISMMGTTTIKGETKIAPFLSFGLDMSAVSFLDDGQRNRGVSIGVHGNLGVHGFLSKSVFWRAQAGYLGAGVGAFKGELALGYVFED